VGCSKSLAHVLFKRTESLALCAVFRVLQVGLIIKWQKKKDARGGCAPPPAAGGPGAAVRRGALACLARGGGASRCGRPVPAVVAPVASAERRALEVERGVANRYTLLTHRNLEIVPVVVLSLTVNPTLHHAHVHLYISR
jgi:hypothetical protein